MATVYVSLIADLLHAGHINILKKRLNWGSYGWSFKFKSVWRVK